MLQIRIGLADTTGTVDNHTMAAAAAALNVQVTRDLPKFWNIDASVEYLPDPHSIPQGVWPVFIVKELPEGEGGFHTTQHNQPYAKVIGTPGSDEWTVDASHETIEMLVDPNGNRLQTATAIQITDDKIRRRRRQVRISGRSVRPLRSRRLDLYDQRHKSLRLHHPGLL